MPSVPCSSGILTKKQQKISNITGYGAIFQKNTIWEQGSKGLITITFGTYDSNQSGCAAWSLVGSDSNSTIPSMNLGFIDPPFGKSFIGVDGITYDLPIYDKNLCACGPTDCDCNCGGSKKEDKNATRNYCAVNSTDTNGCLSSYVSNGRYTGQNWTPGGTVIHEFGHALGMLHEHQNDLEHSNKIKDILNIDNVKKYYTNLTGNSETGGQQAVDNVLEFYYDPSLYLGSTFDNESIMLYYLPNDWIKGCESYESYEVCPNNPTHANLKLSSTDKKWLSDQYPKSSDNWPELTIKFVDSEPEKWKMAWIIKVLYDNYVPVVGIKWIFKDNNDKIITIFDNSTVSFSSNEVDLTAARNSITIDPAVFKDPGVICGLVIAIIAVLFILGFIISRMIRK